MSLAFGTPRAHDNEENVAMWSPEGRKENAKELRKIGDKVLRYRQLCDRFASYFQPDSDSARQLRQLRGRLEDLRARAADREKRLAKGVVKIGVVGLEKQGKSAFLSAWLKSEKLLPSEAERCTWSTTVIEPGQLGQYEATVTYYAEADFKNRIQRLEAVAVQEQNAAWPSEREWLLRFRAEANRLASTASNPIRTAQVRTLLSWNLSFLDEV